MRQHLVKCDKYLTLHKTKGIQNDITREVVSLDFKQTSFNILILFMKIKALLDLDFAEACYISGLSFIIYQNEAMQRKFRTLNLVYKSLNHKALAGSLLDKIYIKIKKKIDLIIQLIKLLNIIINESININNT